MRENNNLFNTIGIDSVGFCAPRYYINLEDLTIYRNIDPKKYLRQTDNEPFKSNKKLKSSVILPLLIPLLFGNMYSASLWAQIIYTLEYTIYNNPIIYFGSYGLGATCISGLLKQRPQSTELIKEGPNMNHYIRNKNKLEVRKYEEIRNKKYHQQIYLGRIKESENNDKRGFAFNFCTEGCLISNYEGLDYCLKGHKGNYKIFFPLYAQLISEPIFKPILYNSNGIKDDLVRIDPNSNLGDILEFELRRAEFENNCINKTLDLIDWAPYYIINNYYYKYMGEF